jgi:protein SCO1
MSLDSGFNFQCRILKKGGYNGVTAKVKIHGAIHLAGKVISCRVNQRCLFLLFAFVFFCGTMQAQNYSAEKPLGAAAQSTPAYLRNAGIDQNLNHSLPLAQHFRDELGNDVAFGNYFGHRPVVMALVYFKCGMLCPQVLHGMGSALKQTGLHLGHDYDVIVVSFDPTDTPADSVEAKQHFLSMLGDASGAGSVHFLTGPQSSITELSQATGFHYVRVPGPDGKMDQFAHSSVIMIATPDGRMSKYLSGVEYQPRDVRLALVEASNHKIGSFSDLILLYCCNYTPSQGRYTVAIMRVMGLAAMGSVLMLALVVYLLGKKPKLAA